MSGAYVGLSFAASVEVLRPVSAQEIVDDLEAALAQFRLIEGNLAETTREMA